MNYSIEIVDTYDREFLTYEIWKENTQIAEVYMEKEKIKLDIFLKKEKIEFDFQNFLKTLKEINDDIIRTDE